MSLKMFVLQVYGVEEFMMHATVQVLTVKDLGSCRKFWSMFIGLVKTMLWELSEKFFRYIYTFDICLAILCFSFASCTFSFRKVVICLRAFHQLPQNSGKSSSNIDLYVVIEINQELSCENEWMLIIHILK